MAYAFNFWDCRLSIVGFTQLERKGQLGSLVRKFCIPAFVKRHLLWPHYDPSDGLWRLDFELFDLASLSE